MTGYLREAVLACKCVSVSFVGMCVIVVHGSGNEHCLVQVQKPLGTQTFLVFLLLQLIQPPGWEQQQP